MTKELERFVNTDEVLRQQLDRRGRVITMQEKNNTSIGLSASKVYDIRSRSPARVLVEHKFVEPPLPGPLPPGSFAGVSTAIGTVYDRSNSPARRFGGGGSPLRSSYRPTYGR